MSAPPVDEWGLIEHLTSWVTWVVGAVVAIVTSTITATYFITSLRNDIEELRKRMDDSVEDRETLRKNIREAVHDLRNEFHKMHGDNQVIMKKIDDHLVRVEARSDQRFDHVIQLLMRRDNQ
jgi:septal ring factor EnvC (AmiA/AmiB activator)